MQSKYKDKEGNQMKDLMYATDGSNFSQVNEKVTPTKKPKGPMSQTEDFLRMESKGIVSIANIISKPPSDRDNIEKQFFVMFLKLKVPFFKDFDKKTLKFIMERTSSQFFKKGKVVHEYGLAADHMLVVIDGQLSCYYETIIENVSPDQEPDMVVSSNETWGEDCMTEEIKWNYSVRATKKTLVMNVHKKDLLEVLQHVKVIQSSNN